MSQRNKNLLEAFKATGASAPPPAAAVPPPPRSTPAPSLFESAPRMHPLTGTRLPVMVLVQLAVVAIAFLLGRWSVRQVAASGDAPTQGSEIDSARAPEPSYAPPPPAQAQVPPPAAGPSQFDPKPHTAAQEALVDARNVYTIKVVEYSNTESNRKLASATLQYLSDQQGLPASIAGTGTRLYILVGAAPDKASLDTLLNKIKTMPGPPPMSKPGEFGDAYKEKIDKVFKRK